jgi:hypothetical protein
MLRLSAEGVTNLIPNMHYAVTYCGKTSYNFFAITWTYTRFQQMEFVVSACGT